MRRIHVIVVCIQRSTLELKSADLAAKEATVIEERNMSVDDINHLKRRRRKFHFRLTE